MPSRTSIGTFTILSGNFSASSSMLVPPATASLVAHAHAAPTLAAVSTTTKLFSNKAASEAAKHLVATLQGCCSIPESTESLLWSQHVACMLDPLAAAFGSHPQTANKQGVTELVCDLFSRTLAARNDHGAGALAVQQDGEVHLPCQVQLGRNVQRVHRLAGGAGLLSHLRTQGKARPDAFWQTHIRTSYMLELTECLRQLPCNIFAVASSPRHELLEVTVC